MGGHPFDRFFIFLIGKEILAFVFGYCQFGAYFSILPKLIADEGANIGALGDHFSDYIAGSGKSCSGIIDFAVGIDITRGDFSERLLAGILGQNDFG
ncbi:hypothetical protein SDC9_100543 [bioreactor metagenome]|uniref:Uncharacterized protein n=1 Tax=bioreactor metagenome TaxID=1076179 RepID=A0A645AW57_9ZZZZ